MNIDAFCHPSKQMAQLGKHIWSVARLFTLAKDLKVMDIPLDHLNIYYKYEDLTLREMVGHIKSVNDADLSYPIILDEDGEVMDGRHRIMKAILDGEQSIKAVRFDKNPEPCEVKSDVA
jgi:hypothetical protein